MRRQSSSSTLARELLAERVYDGFSGFVVAADCSRVADAVDCG